MKKFKNLILYLLALQLLSCDQINKTQTLQVKQSFHCYQKLNAFLLNEKYLQEIERAAKTAYFSLQFIPKTKFSLIPSKEVFHIVSSGGFDDCQILLDSLGDFKGLQFINQNLILYYITELNLQAKGRWNLGISRFETHCLIYNNTDSKIKRSDFVPDDQIVMKFEQWDNHWFYLVFATE